MNKMKAYFPKFFTIQHWVLFLICFSQISCSSTFDLYQDQGGPLLSAFEGNVLTPEMTLKPGDKINISIWGHELLSIGSANSQFNSGESTGRWVIIDDEGEVNLPKIGRVKLSDLTAKEAGYFLEQKYSTHLNKPVINVRVLNHFVTVLGEVGKPGNYNLENDNVSLHQLLGDANGLTHHAKTNAVSIIRKVNDKPYKIPVDLTRFQTLENSNPVLRPGDLVYVPPRKGKEIGKKAGKAAPFVGIVTGVAVLISVFK